MKTPKITLEEIGIIKNAKAGKESAFNLIYYKYKDFVINLLYQYINDYDEAKDLSNIVFLKIYQKLSKFTDYSSFGVWLRKTKQYQQMTRNQVYNYRMLLVLQMKTLL